jgi:hypothetical protein
VPTAAPFARGPFRRRRSEAAAGATAIPIPSAPATPSTPYPADTATAYYSLLTWASAGATKFDVYLDTVTPPVVQVGIKSVGTSFTPTLAASTTYYWKIVAWNDGGSATGPIWSFTTLPASSVITEVNGAVVSSIVRWGSIQIHDVLGPQPNTASLVFDTNAPTGGELIKIGLGLLDANKLIFGGEVQGYDQTYAGTAAINTFYPVTLVDHTFRLNKRRPYGSFVNVSASIIARSLIATYATGFTANHVQDGLPNVTINFDGSQPFLDCLKTLADAISDTTRTAKLKLDYNRDLHLFFTETTTSPNPVDLTHPPLQIPSPLKFSIDHSQIRTLINGKGHGERLLADVGSGETILPIADASMFNPAGGRAIAAITSDGAQTQQLTYSGVQLGGSGALVGPGASPGTGLTAVTAAGTGLNAGTYQYAYTDVTGSGESLPSPLTTKVVTLTLPAPGGFGGNTNTPGNDLSVGTYQWAITDINAAGETLPSPTATLITDGQISDPTTAATVLDISATGSWPGGLTVLRVAYLYRNSDGTFHTAFKLSSDVFINNGNHYQHYTASGPCSLDSRVAAVDVYVSQGGTNDYTLEVSAANVVGTNWSVFVDVGSGATAPPSNNFVFRRPVLTSLPIGPASTTSRKLYRTVVNGSQLKLLATLNLTDTTYTDTTPDGSLGANAPTSNTATSAQVALSGIAVGPSGTTQRKVYRTAVNAAQLKLQSTIADNTTTTATDAVADGALGANAPVTDTSGLAQPTGQVLAGATSLTTSNAAPFQVNGGWASLSGGQVIRYTGLATNTLTGIPASGPGAITATITFNSTAVATPALTNINAANGVAMALARGSSVNIFVQRNDVNAQAALGQIEKDVNGNPTDGIREYTFTDQRLSETTLTTLCDANLAIFSRPIVSATYYTRDPQTASGKTVSINLGWGQVGTFTIQTVDIAVDALNVNPLYRVQATSVAFTLSDLLRRVTLT